jgi:hypothetical protein
MFSALKRSSLFTQSVLEDKKDLIALFPVVPGRRRRLIGSVFLELSSLRQPASMQPHIEDHGPMLHNHLHP